MNTNNDSTHKVLQFPHDENVSVLLPKNINSMGYFVEYLQRPEKEKKFRKLVSVLVKTNIIDKTKNVIDLGAWIGDNTIPWAKYFKGKIYAIDPSTLNCNFIKQIATLNNKENVEVFNFPISDKIETVYFSGSEHHIQFNTSGGPQNYKTETIDNLFKTNKITNIGFIHLDVEGFEHKVISGALNVIEKYTPPIIWENHLDTDNFLSTIQLLREKNYKTWMINEISGCNPSCRNFISIQKNINCNWVEIEQEVGLGNLIEYSFE